MWVGSERIPLCASANEESDSLVNNALLTGYEPRFFDDYHFSETTEIFIHESSTDSRPSNLHDYTIGRALSSPLFTQEREDAASPRQACHSPEEGLSSSQSLSVGQVRTGSPLMSLDHQFQTSEKNQVATQKMSKSRFLWNDKKEQILADFRAEIQKHEFLIREVSKH